MSVKDDIVKILDKVPLFQRFDQRQLKHLAAQFADRKYQTGQEIVTQGREGIGLFIVVSGHVEAVRERLDGTKLAMNQFGPGDFFGEMALLDDGPPQSRRSVWFCCSGTSSPCSGRNPTRLLWSSNLSHSASARCCKRCRKINLPTLSCQS
jgi:CRP-like cAMP-binding protein